MDIGAAAPIFTHKNIKEYMEQLYPYPIKWVEDIVAILNFWIIFGMLPKKCDKNGHLLGFVPHTYISLFEQKQINLLDYNELLLIKL